MSLILSHKGMQMPSSPIRKLVPYAEDARRRGIEVLHLNIGQPDIHTPQPALDAIRALDDKVLAYTHSAGTESYRRKLAGFYNDRGIDVGHDDMLVTTGASEAITMAFTVCMDPGDEVIIPEPFYANYNAFAMATGVVVRPVTSCIEDDFALPPIVEFEKLITPRTRAIMICNPNNPTGYLYSRGELDTLRDIVLRHGLYLMVDEVYSDFFYEDGDYTSVMQLEGLERHAIMFDSVSKRYSMCGVRIGALVTRNREVLGAALRIAQSRLCPPLVGQVAAEAAVDTPQSYFDGVKAEYIARRDQIVGDLGRMEGVRCPSPRGAFYVTAGLPIDDSDRFARWLLEEFSMDGRTVMLAPATGFYATPGLGRDQVRIAYVLNREKLAAAAACLERALKAYPGRRPHSGR